MMLDQREAFERIWSQTDRGLDPLTKLRLVPVRHHLRGRILDIGAGDGQVTRYLPNANVISLDLVHASCVRVTRRGFRAIQGDAGALPFTGGSFDTVTVLEVIEHLPDPVHLLHEIKRVLRPGGTLICSTPNQGVSVVEGFRVLLKFHVWPKRDNLHVWDPFHEQRFTVPQLQAFAVEAGFEAGRTWLLAKSAFAFGYYFADRVGARLGLPPITEYVMGADRFLWFDRAANILAVFKAR